jgi:integrase
MGKNSMPLIKIKGVTMRNKKTTEITVRGFQKLINELSWPLNVMVIVDGCLGLGISELSALKWTDIDLEAKKVNIQRKSARGKIARTKSDASEAELPLADSLLNILAAWKQKSDKGEWVFPSPRNRGPRCASMLLQNGLKPIARHLGLGNIKWHTFRNACWSWLSSGGAAVGTQKGRLRQAYFSSTLNIYGQALTAEIRAAHEGLAKQLLPHG